MKYIWFLTRVFVGTVFAYAGLSKLMEPVENFAAVLGNYDLIPVFLVGIFARLVPWMEWVLGGFLVVGYAPKQVARIMAAMTGVFLGTLVYSFLTGGSDSDCGCFGSSGIQLSKKQMFILDIVDFAILLRLSFMDRFSFSADGLIRDFKLKKPIVWKKKKAGKLF
jgi:uncharacterized membrane protein YphA (DoxX/SURF4 family)